ncbi:hypothetical protein N5K55_09110 [Pseudomonas aeruginosa]|nr:hypothetical protein [Pseudomonas aeruginosa]
MDGAPAIRRLQRRRGRCPGTLEGAVERACRGVPATAWQPRAATGLALARPAERYRAARPEQPSSRRRFVGGALGLFVLLAGGAGLERWVQAGMGLPGELATGTGERRDWLLADGSRLRLNAREQRRDRCSTAPSGAWSCGAARCAWK